MDEAQTDGVTPASSAPTVRQGCLTIAGGAALGFFGCLGGVFAGSDPVSFVFLFLGAGVILWGVARVAAVIWRAMSRPL